MNSVQGEKQPAAAPTQAVWEGMGTAPGQQGKAQGDTDAVGNALMMIVERGIVQEAEDDVDIREVGHRDISPQRRPAIGFVLPYGEAINEVAGELMGDRGGHR